MSKSEDLGSVTKSEGFGCLSFKAKFGDRDERGETKVEAVRLYE